MNIYNDGHRDRRLDALRGQKVRIKFRDGDVEEGFLVLATIGGGYILKTPGYDLRFYKSHVRKVEALNGRTEERRA